MKKRRKEEIENFTFINDIIVINRNDDDTYFEIGSQSTYDVAEAVSILMRQVSNNDDVWQTPVLNIDIENITPEKSLYWLTGGIDEWDMLDNYNRPWCDCYLDFQEEFGFMIINAVKKAKKLGDVRDYFNKYLNLVVLYDYAISKNFIR